ncbi:MAG: helix-turn-helix transcriptional regulator [Clostridia bacterium]|nr:helix-turn-helix transcriptional regulator [Clostridia bacterium]
MHEFDIKEMGNRILWLRLDKKLGQNKLAEILSVSNASISYWETGKQVPSAEVIYKLAKFFNVSADYILGLTDILL